MSRRPTPRRAHEARHRAPPPPEQVASYWISIAFYNFCGLAVAKALSSVHRCLVDACRTIVVWSIDLLMFRLTSQYGEPWKPGSSPIQLCGFAVMVLGTFTYYQVDGHPESTSPARIPSRSWPRALTLHPLRTRPSR